MLKRVCNSAYFSIISSLIAFNCYAVDPSTYYYPPTSPGDDAWTTVDASSLGWDADALNDAISYAGEQNSMALLILHKGRIVSENYWGDWNLHTMEPIFSAHKTMAGLVFGIAQDENLVNRNDFVSNYLDDPEDPDGWSNATAVQEGLILIRHLQTMTSGLSGLNYVTDPDTEWRYNTLAYQRIKNIIGLQNPDGDYDDFINARLYDRIGMNDSGPYIGSFTRTSSNSARDMARFGLMMLGNGTWNGMDIIEDKDYLAEMSIPSQNFNEAYGNLTWINGQGSYMVPLDPAVYAGELIPATPADLFAALGRDDKKIYMVPSLDLVVVRHGPAADTSSLGPSGFDNELWERLCLAMNDCQPVDTTSACTDWTEDFALANGTIIDAGSTAWSTDDSALSIASPSDYFEVRNAEFIARDIDGEGVWMGEVISTGGGDFTVSVDIRETGRHENSDYIRLSYILDSGAEVEFANHNNDFGTDGITESSGILSGDNVQIVIRARNNGGREVHYWDDVSVNCQ